MIYSSQVMSDVVDRIRRMARCDLAVLVHGPTGSGKELVAAELHRLSGRSGAFVAVNCGALSSGLVESELFGHERGAFTGAEERRAGLFEAADRGTLFLDEIGELPLSLQPRLLRVLETGAVRRIGSATETRVDVRIVAATHRDLPSMVAEGRFREDLLHRLGVLTVSVPPLGVRREDVVALARHFLPADAPPLSPEALQRLMLHDWPGNVRELRNAVVRAAVLARGPSITAEDLELGPPVRPPPRNPSRPRRHLSDLGPEEQRRLLEETLRTCGDNRSRAARRLGISRSTLHERLRRLGIGPRHEERAA